MRIGTGPTRSLFPHRGALIECEAEPGELVEVPGIGTARTVPLGTPQTCAWCQKTYTANEHSRMAGVPDQCDACTASGQVENHHSDEGHDGEAGRTCADCVKDSEDLLHIMEAGA